MIKVIKDLNTIPGSLIPAFEDLFPDRAGKNVVPIPVTSRTTHKRRMELIQTASYADSPIYNGRYKLDDIREALQEIYKGKCAYCEQKEEVSNVEHYRPKNVYYWLAFSWDNLLMACPTCNGHKGTNFAIDGTLITFENNEDNIRVINTSSANYDALEIPRMVNPEITDPTGYIYFEKNGEIKSDHQRFAYTIEKCKIDRKGLNDSRRSLLDRFREHIRDAFIVNASVHDQLVAMKTNLRNFIRDSEDETEEFLAFRQYAIAEDWIGDIVKEEKN